MIIVRNHELDEGVRIALKMPPCITEKQEVVSEQLLLCLFCRRKNIGKCFQKCEQAKFRLSWEADSPLFFKEFLAISDSQRRIHNYIGGELEQVSYDQLREAQVEISELRQFVETVFIALYPLFIINDSRFPFLDSGGIKKAKELLLSKDSEKVMSDILDADEVWMDRIFNMMEKLSLKYKKGLVFLFSLFLIGLKKEKEELFRKIEGLA